MTKQILIVDDDIRVLRYLHQGLLELGSGYVIAQASSADEALKFVETQTPHLIITDLRMPGMNGIELITEIQKRYPNVPFVLMTAYGTEDVQEAARKLGVYRFITKPFRTENLLHITRSALAENDETAVNADGILIISKKSLVAINTILTNMRTELRPELALMGDMAGHLITHVGTTMGLDLNSLVALVAGNFATGMEIDNLFERGQAVIRPDEQNDRPLYITYLEGRYYDCYSANVGKSLFFTVVFSRRGASSKIGMVWLMMRRYFHQLQDAILAEQSTLPPDILANNTETVTDMFRTLFDRDSPS